MICSSALNSKSERASVFAWNPLKAVQLFCFRIHHHNPLPPLHPQPSQCRLPHSLSPMPPDLHELLRIHPLPCPHQRTNGRMLAWSTSDRTCGQCGKKTSAIAVELLIMQHARMTFA